MDFLLVILLSTTLLLAAPAEETISLREHFPLEDGFSWRYDSNLGEVNTSVAIKGDRIIVDSRSRRLDIIQVYLLSPEGVLLTSAHSDTFLFSSTRTYHPFLLRFPAEIRIGQTWEWEGKEVVERKSIIKSRVRGSVQGKEKITVPAGEFDCLKVKVTTWSDDGTVSISTQWLASGVGIVKAEVGIDAGGLSGMIIALLGFDTYFLELVEMRAPDGVVICPDGRN